MWSSASAWIPPCVRTPDGLANDPRQEAADFDRSIRDAGGIDLQILGIGSNGHLAFNEPPSAFDSRTRVVELAQRTREDNARFFRSAADVPTHAITQGLGTIFEARQLLLIAHGEGKAQAVARAVEGPVTKDFPASLIQRHPRATLVLDEAAASRLQPSVRTQAACVEQPGVALNLRHRSRELRRVQRGVRPAGLQQ